MNDLNSVFLVGRVKGSVFVSKDKKWISFWITNNTSSFDEQKKEYVSKSIDIRISLTGEWAVKQYCKHLKAKTRIGVNGKVSMAGTEFFITAYSIQFLDKTFKDVA